MERYFVVATQWSEKDNAQIKVIIGEFSRYIYASIFKDAYNDRYKADATVIDGWNIVNNK